MPKIFPFLVNTSYIITKRFFQQRLTYLASALTYTTLLSLVPFLTVALAILSTLPVSHTLTNNFRQLILENFVPTSSQAIYQYLDSFVAQSAKLSIIGSIFLVMTSIMTVMTIEDALNEIWQVESRSQTLKSWLYYLIVLILAPLFIGISASATYYVATLKAINSLGIDQLLIRCISFIVNFLFFSLLYIMLPNCRVPIKPAMIGAFIAAFILEVTKYIFVLYLSNFGNYEFIYGALAAIPIFLIWLYLLWIIILMGSLISNVLTKICEKIGH